MSKRNRLLTIAAVTLALAFSNTAAAAPPQVFHYSFNGLTASANFETLDSSGCISTFVSVGAIDGRIHQAGGPDVFSLGIIFVNQYDSCASTTLLSAAGTVDLPDVEIMNTLQSATLNTTIKAFDSVSNTSLTIEVNLRWEGFGRRFSSHSRTMFRGLTYKSDQSDIGISRYASAVGNVTLAGTNLAPNPTTNAQIGSDKVGSLYINY